MNPLINQLNSFDFFYVHSDDHRVWDRWNKIEKELKTQIALHPEIESDPELSERARDYFFPQEEPKVDSDLDDIIF